VTHTIDVQLAIDDANVPENNQLTLWANSALREVDINSELTIRIVDEVEGTRLNEEWRKKNGATNVLSFPADVTDKIQPKFLGDIVICAPIVAREANEQGKLIDAHWAHMVIHGTLHLLGYDHIDRQEAERMESLEIDILNTLNLDNPYT
jgi:probable rRNA maturation factor